MAKGPVFDGPMAWAVRRRGMRAVPGDRAEPQGISMKMYTALTATNLQPYRSDVPTSAP